MGLYDIALGDGNQAARGALLTAILGGLRPPRFRDAWVEKGGDGEPVIAIYTRTGGGNREGYATENAAMAAHPCYLRDRDDTFDSTYATFYFRVPEGAPADVREALAEVATDPVDMDERWQQAIARVGSGELRPAEVALGDQLAAFLSDPEPPSRVMEI